MESTRERLAGIGEDPRRRKESGGIAGSPGKWEAARIKAINALPGISSGGEGWGGTKMFCHR